MLSRLLELIRPGPLDSRYQGASFRLYHRGSATERGALLNPDYNLDELKFLRAHLRDGGVFVDVGANVGTFALAVARDVGTQGKVIAIEPHPLAQARLAFNRAASGCGQVALVRAAAGACDGEVPIETDRDNLAASRIVAGNASGSAIRVPSLRLQRILEEAGVAQVDALKIDVEGYEDRVLAGFFREAPRALWPRAIVIEHLARRQWQDDCLADLAARGYTVSGRTHSNTLLVRN
jgi:FkbM family methyltransferase